MSVKDKFGKIKIKAKPIALVALSIIGSIASKILTDKFEKQINIDGINVNIYNYIINSLSDSAIMDFFSQFEKKDKIIESIESNDIDIAYDFILNNIQFKINDYIDINFQKNENSISINYVFNKQYSDYFYQQGISINELFALASTIGEMNVQLLECLEENLNFIVPIDMKVYTNYGDLLIYIQNGQLKELNGIRPVLTTQNL